MLPVPRRLKTGAKSIEYSTFVQHDAFLVCLPSMQLLLLLLFFYLSQITPAKKGQGAQSIDPSSPSTASSSLTKETRNPLRARFQLCPLFLSRRTALQHQVLVARRAARFLACHCSGRHRFWWRFRGSYCGWRLFGGRKVGEFDLFLVGVW